MPIIFAFNNLRAPTRLGTPALVDGFIPLTPTKLIISGITKDSAGSVLASCTVSLYRTSDDSLMERTTSDGSGAYSFSAIGLSETYYIVAYKAGSPDVSGTTVNTLLGA